MTGREKRLRAAGFACYQEYLRSAHWLGLRLAYRRSAVALKQCFVCGSPDYELHHRTYARVPFEERLGDLIPLCRDHHSQVHQLVRARQARNTKHRGGLAICALELKRAQQAGEAPHTTLQSNPPAGLTGKQRGLWYRDRYRNELATIHTGEYATNT